MEEYIRLEEEKACRRGKVYNWETVTYGKIWYDEDVLDPRSVETEFPAIVFNDSLTSNKTHSYEPNVSSLNDEIDFRISFDESNDEDYTVVFDKISFSYKIISTNDLKTNLENDNEKVNMPLFPLPDLEDSYFDNLDFFKDFEIEFSAIIYNDAQTSKLDFLTEPTDNNPDDKIDIEHSSRDLSVKPLPDVINTDVCAYAQGSNKLLETSHDTSNKFFKTETFIKELNVTIMTWNRLNKGMSFIFLIKKFTVNMAYLLNEYSVFDTGSVRRILGNGYGVSTSCTVLGPYLREIDEYWCRIYKSGNLEALES
uniref:Uncharacterized protein n=1 Tax=Tanacetum cinerariifolium TaxID=118510 RepID=A0A6L2LV30_TANCI|nr:hypothetical protein [Tanacetum cinerariifolium]